MANRVHCVKVWRPTPRPQLLVDSLHPAFDFIVFKFLDFFYVEAGELFPVVVIAPSPRREVSCEGNRFAPRDQSLAASNADHLGLRWTAIVISSVLPDLTPWLLE